MNTTTNRPRRHAGTTSARRLLTRSVPAQLRPVMLAAILAAGTVAADSGASNSLGLVAWDEPSLSFTCDAVTTEEINLPLFTQFFGSMAAFANPPRCSNFDSAVFTVAAPETGMPFRVSCISAFGNESEPKFKSAVGTIPFMQLLSDQAVRSYRVEYDRELFGVDLISQPFNDFTIGGPGIPSQQILMNGSIGSFRKNVEPINQHVDVQGTLGYLYFTPGGGSGVNNVNIFVSIFLSSSVYEDLNEDGTVDGADLGLLLGAWETTDTVADLNNSGFVDGGDLGVLLASWS